MSEPKKLNSIWTMSDSAKETAELFRTFTPGTPDLIPTGIRTLDTATGGLEPATVLIIGATTGVGKSMVMQSALQCNQASGVKTGGVSLEDAPGVFGCRVLARASQVDSVKIRTKTFNSSELLMLEQGQMDLERDAKSPHSSLIAYNIGGSLEAVLKSLEALADAGCKLIYVDYIQKIKGSHDDRKTEVSRAFSEMQRVAAEKRIALAVLSQVSRQQDEAKVPSIRALKETGDLENEARMILMLAKNGDGVHGVLRKSTFGAEGTKVHWNRGPCGTLFEQLEDGETDDDDF